MQNETRQWARLLSVPSSYKRVLTDVDSTVSTLGVLRAAITFLLGF